MSWTRSPSSTRTFWFLISRACTQALSALSIWTRSPLSGNRRKTPWSLPPGRASVAEQLRSRIGEAVGGFVRERFGCESCLELEFEKMYRRFFLPEVRGGKIGSKKRYAGLLVEAGGSERLEFVGLESVRRDWSDVSKRFQNGLLDLVFHDQAVEDFVRGFVAGLRAGRFDRELVYRKAV